MNPSFAEFLDQFVKGPSFSSGPKKFVIEELVSWAENNDPRYHVSVNALTLYWARRNPQYRQAMMESSMATPDGNSLALLAWIMGRPVLETLPGIELAERVMEIGASRGWRFVFVGAHERALALAQDKLRMKYPGLRCERLLWLPGDDFAARLGTLARKGGINAVFTGLAMPVQELWLQRYRHVIGCGMMMGLGGSFEVWAGLAARAPRPWRRLGLEWLYRFLQEPFRRRKPVFRSLIETARVSGELSWSKMF